MVEVKDDENRRVVIVRRRRKLNELVDCGLLLSVVDDKAKDFPDRFRASLCHMGKGDIPFFCDSAQRSTSCGLVNMVWRRGGRRKRSDGRRSKEEKKERQQERGIKTRKYDGEDKKKLAEENERTQPVRMECEWKGTKTDSLGDQGNHEASRCRECVEGEQKGRGWGTVALRY